MKSYTLNVKSYTHWFKKQTFVGVTPQYFVQSSLKTKQTNKVKQHQHHTITKLEQKLHRLFPPIFLTG